MTGALQTINNWLPTIGWSSLIAFFLFLIKLGWKANGWFHVLIQEWKQTKEDILASKELLTTVTHNHLTHIQESGERTAQALENQREVMGQFRDAMRQNIDATNENSRALGETAKALSEIRGFLQGQASKG